VSEEETFHRSLFYYLLLPSTHNNNNNTKITTFNNKMNKHFIKLVILLSLMALVSVAKCELLDKMRASQFNALHDSTVLNKQNNKNSTRKSQSDAAELGEIMFEYFRDILNRDKINLSPGIAFEKKSMNDSSAEHRQRRRGSHVGGDATSLISQLRQFTNDHVLTVNLARASTETARLFFFKGECFFCLSFC
jgi:hypothetical protein